MELLPVSVKERQKGQALLLILLVMALVVTLILSSVSRSVTDVEISKYEDNSIRAFDAAQAGIEKAVVGGAASGTLSNQAKYTTISGSYQKHGNSLKYPIDLYSGESALFWLVDHYKNADDDYVIVCPGGASTGVGDCNSSNIPNWLTVCWGNKGVEIDQTETPAIYIEFYYTAAPKASRNKFESGDFGDIKIATASADPNTVPRGNFWPRFLPTGSNCSSIEMEFSNGFKEKNGSTEPNEILWNYLNTGNGGSEFLLILAKVTLLYNSSYPQPVAVKMPGGGNFPSQGTVVASIGESQDVSRKLILNQGFPEIPGEFTHVLFSKKSMTK